MPRATVVGSGPNGLAAANYLADTGFSVTVVEASDHIGGGVRSADLTGRGLVHDMCSAVHPFGVMSPYFRRLRLDRWGLRWAHPEAALAHPLDDGTVGLVWADLARMVSAAGPDGPVWAGIFGRTARRFDRIAPDLLRPPLGIPRAPAATIPAARIALHSGCWLIDRFTSATSRAVVAGSAAHVMAPLDGAGSAGVGLMLLAAAHAGGWPVAVGGSASIATALSRRFVSLGGRIEVGRPVRTFDDLPAHDVVLFDTSPEHVVHVYGDRLPLLTRRGFSRRRHLAAAFKVDLVIRGDIPWSNPDSGRAGTVHLGGCAEEVVAAEADVTAGRMPTAPFVLVAQQYLADPGRSRNGLNPVWAYAHVPWQWPGDATEAAIAQIERFAPGVRERIVDVVAHGTVALETHNANYIGGDIGNGANTLSGLLARPRPSLHPYDIGIDGAFLCSAAAPPGAGVHGMAGYHAAVRATRWWARHGEETQRTQVIAAGSRRCGGHVPLGYPR